MSDDLSNFSSSQNIINDFFLENLDHLRKEVQTPYLDKRYKEMAQDTNIEDECQNMLQEINKRYKNLSDLIEMASKLI